ncbi:MAG: hypothetical protein IKA06_05380 [Clostridia bacterium]|nr:hypothetical protein [Clostridia bacterium]
MLVEFWIHRFATMEYTFCMDRFFECSKVRRRKFYILSYQNKNKAVDRQIADT